MTSSNTTTILRRRARKATPSWCIPAAQGLTNNINTIKSELTTAGKPDTPIYVGEIGGPYSNPGKQSWSITQGLYAGQVLGEMMNEGVVAPDLVDWLRQL